MPRQPVPKTRHKCTNEELEERIWQIARMLGKQRTKTEIHRACTREWNVHWRTVDEYIVRARTILHDKETAQEEIDKIAALYREHMRSENPSISLAAARQYVELKGLAAVKLEISGPGGKAVQVEQTVKTFDFATLETGMRKLFGIVDDNSSEQPVHPALTNGETSDLPKHNGC